MQAENVLNTGAGSIRGMTKDPIPRADDQPPARRRRKKPVKVCIAHSERLTADAFRCMLLETGEVEVVAMADSIDALFSSAESLKFDVVLCSDWLEAGGVRGVLLHSS